MAEAWDPTSLSAGCARLVCNERNAKCQGKPVREKGAISTLSVVAF